jgi:V8-like Glu-specific endopeptidase
MDEPQDSMAQKGQPSTNRDEGILSAMARAAREPESFEIHPLRRKEVGPDIPGVPGWVPTGPDTSDEPEVMPESPAPRVRWGDQDLIPLSGIFLPDGRRSYTDTRFPWRCVCKVASGTKGGSGVLIGARHVLTASHVIDWRARSASVSFIRNGMSFASAAVTDAFYFEEINDVDYDNADSDYCILALDAHLGDTLGFLGAQTYDSGWDDEVSVWMNIAYAPDIAGGNNPSFQTDFFLDEDEFDLGGGRTLFTETGDFVPGMSGSPVFASFSGDLRVVGVASAAGSGIYDQNFIAGGNDLTKLVHHARATLP